MPAFCFGNILRPLHTKGTAPCSRVSQRRTLHVIFIETPIFTKHAIELLDDEGLALLFRTLILRPSSGRIIEGTGGIRKVRMAAKGHGKRESSTTIL